ncbi:C4-dicarboxylate TRAP transporter substrate-binding protein [Chachezhania sediminis]|uniref:C4-dicarboxylate TRAP transporter substrate-binding protein n=1 Tax=Chachezhania sediminis TaxID=2599291 RepID=UPI00131AFC13|nr:C4-dicarboxylate TRAP transporter substrate-binding protein [Chachezhania sediminis]
MTRILAASAAVLAIASTGAAADTKLTYGSWLPPTHVVVEKGLQPFFDRVAADSNGSLTWELFSGGSMGGPKESLQIVKDGLVDSSLLVDVYYKSELPVAVTMSDLFMLVDDQIAWGAALTETQLLDCPQCEAEFKKHDLKPLAFYSGGDYHLMCTEEVHTLDQVKDKKVRASTRNGALSEHWGAVPVSITTAEMYEAMQRGQADCTIGAYAWLNSYGLKDLVTSIVETPIGGIFSALVMYTTEDRWADLSDEERTILLKEMPQLVADINFSYYEEGLEAAQQAKADGIEFYAMGDDMKASFDEFLKGEIGYSEEKAREAGVDDPSAIVDALMKNVEKWKGIMAEIGMDRQKYAEKLWSEIYSKL